MVRVWAGILASILALAGAARAAEPVLYVEQPALLAQLGKMGYAFADLFGHDGDGNLESLYAAAPAYRAVADTIAGDVADLRADIQAGGRPLSEFTAAETGRIMDMRWLKTDVARFRLVGIVNRLDRRDFHELLGETGCGEVRLIYRLAYAFRKDGKGKLLSSRMPFNFNAVFDVKSDADGGCMGVAGRWTPAIDESLDAVKGVGFCSPTYFVFQMRIDNHATPWSKGPGRSGGEEAIYRSVEVDEDPDGLW